MFVIFYFLLIRPQQKKTKQHREMISDLKKGDRIITSGGIHGRITGIDETTLTVVETATQPPPEKTNKPDSKKSK
ncbi:MAG: preprotein translocase subunit YajC [Deltaproteobacteria bacterium]|nr:preprotein translocase subunit YajC [Deltaproteobacteria bacterium]